jgi:spore maturation protein SpmB
VQVKKTRHAVPAALIGDVVAAIATVAVCYWLFV